MTTRLASNLPATTRPLRPGSGCPTALAPVMARDGLLFRLTLPAGRIGAEAFARIAEVSSRAGGSIEVTNRANLQLRGIPAAMSDEALDALLEASGLDAVRLQRRRTILASPLAGLIGGDAPSMLGLVEAIDEALMSLPAAESLSPKFGIAVDFGVPGLSGAERMDVVVAPNGPDLVRLRAACFREEIVMRCGAVPDAIRALAGWLVRRGAARLRELAGCEPPSALSGFVEAREPRAPAAEMDAPPHLGRLAAGVVSAAIPFGALSPQAASAIAANALPGSEIRLAPWPGVVLTRARDEALSGLAAAGLVLEGDDARLKLFACVGASGCVRVDARTREDALAVAAAMSDLKDLAPTVHVSGCARGCAHPGRATILALGRADGAYDLHLDAAPAEAADRAAVAAGVRPEDLPQAIRTLSTLDRN